MIEGIFFILGLILGALASGIYFYSEGRISAFEEAIIKLEELEDTIDKLKKKQFTIRKKKEMRK